LYATEYRTSHHFSLDRFGGEGGGEGNTIQEKLTELAKREAEVYRIVFEEEKELTDRALKLVEVGKPKSNWEGLLGAAAFAIGLLIGR